ncbi:MAG: hypothetical protein K940chlam5_00982 [Candidatus Anoxychlamydiales bacterium]|nr:hypothetical protein [Candidatus Anoxychlamydiales bacterium]
MSISRSNGLISNELIIKNGCFIGALHEREALEALEDLEALREKENRNALISDFGESFSIPSEYSLNKNRNFDLFECEVTVLNSFPANGDNNIINPDLQMPSDDLKTEIRDFFQEALENLDKMDIDHLSGLQELTALILISKEHYEKHEEFTKELIDNLFKKIVEKLEIIKKPLYEALLHK